MSAQPEKRERPETTGGNRSGFSRFTRRAAVVVGLVTAVVIVLLFLWTIAQVLLLIFAGLLLAVLLRGLADRVSARTPLSPRWALLVVGLLLLGGLFGGARLVAPQLSAQFDALGETLPRSVEALEQQLSRYAWYQRVVGDTPSAQRILTGRTGIWSRVTGVVSTVFGVLANTLIIVVVGIYVAFDPGLYSRGIVQLVPVSHRERASEVLGAVRDALWHWLIGQFISMTIIGVLVWLGLMLLGIPVALALGLIAGLFEFVPLIGPWAGAVPGVLVALTISPTKALYAALIYLGVQQIESNVVTPIVMQQAVALPPVLTIASTVAGGVLFGIPGILLATPLVVAAKVLVEKLYVEDVLGDVRHRRAT